MSDFVLIACVLPMFKQVAWIVELELKFLWLDKVC